MANELINIELLKYPHKLKCECCNRVLDIYYKITIYSVEKSNFNYIVGDLDFCKTCGDNFNQVLGNKSKPDEKVLKEFHFDIE